MPIIFFVILLASNTLLFLQFLCFFLLNIPTSLPTEITDSRYVPLSLAVIFLLNIVSVVLHALIVRKNKRLKEL